MLVPTLLCLIGLTAQSAQAQTQVGMEIGRRPDALALESVHGGRVDLGQVIGHRPVLLEFWATWCPKCRALHPKMEAAHAEFGDRVDFYGVAVAVGQNPRGVRRHLERHPLPFPMLWDARGDAVRTFMAPVTSYVVILDADGRVAYTGVDSGQDILGALRRVVGAP
ncbi:MAG: TlpA family protein disulfide reductase [Gemmatimonadota bacterium]|nr:TlpA family protein disulfide reductase [Gemmatimonadota bacterium]